MAKIIWAPDGEHFQLMKEGSIDKMWNEFNFSTEIREQIRLNRFAKFRLIGDENVVVGELPRPNMPPDEMKSYLTRLTKEYQANIGQGGWFRQPKRHSEAALRAARRPISDYEKVIDEIAVRKYRMHFNQLSEQQQEDCLNDYWKLAAQGASR